MRARVLFATGLALAVAVSPDAQQPRGTRRFPFPTSQLQLSRGLTTGAFFDVVGRRSALFGYEGQPLEAWVYPLKVLDRFSLSFRLEGYPLVVPLAELPGTIEVRPEATILTSAHAAFTVRQVLFAPVDESAAVVLLDVDTTLPMTIVGSFRPALRPMWPADAPTPNVNWDAGAHLYEMSDDAGRHAAVVGVPDGADQSVMPYQEEPRDVPFTFAIPISPETARREFVPIVIAAAMDGRASARASYSRVLDAIEPLYRKTVDHYRGVLDSGVALSTPDARLDRAFAWARVGMDKGLATNPTLGTGLLAGFRTSGNSERPGFAWFFGRDALWTSLALTASGALDTARAALEFLAKYQRDDGKIPHEISQSAALVRWFDAFPYAWASADATPLYVIAHADFWRTTRDRAFLQRHWPSIVKAYRFSAASDADDNGLIDNTGVGHGWVEGGALYPPHEEIYLQGLWIEASRRFAEMAAEMRDGSVDGARAAAEKTRQALESTYWIGDRSQYAFATARPRKDRPIAEPGPNRQRRQQRLDELASATLVDEDTVLPAVPMWWGLLDPARADAELDRLGSAAMATDWGHRILSNASALYDPLSYHYGSVWPLFTGWASMAAYRYGRPHVGHQALLANALLTEQGALGYVTELLSGDFNAAFGRSSHHQIWSEAMVVSPVVRGLFGIEPLENGTRVRIAPQLPAHWDHARARGVVAGGSRFDVEIARGAGVLTVTVARDARAAGGPDLVIAPAFPLDAQIDRVTVNGRPARPSLVRTGDVQFAEVAVDASTPRHVAEYRYRGGSDVHVSTPAPEPGARSEGIRVLRSRADQRVLRLLLEGVNGRSYDLSLDTPRQVGTIDGGTLVPGDGPNPVVRVTFDGPAGEYSRREVVVRLR